MRMTVESIQAELDELKPLVQAAVKAEEDAKVVYTKADAALGILSRKKDWLLKTLDNLKAWDKQEAELKATGQVTDEIPW